MAEPSTSSPTPATPPRSHSPIEKDIVDLPSLPESDGEAIDSTPAAATSTTAPTDLAPESQAPSHLPKPERSPSLVSVHLPPEPVPIPLSIPDDEPSPPPAPPRVPTPAPAPAPVAQPTFRLAHSRGFWYWWRKFLRFLGYGPNNEVRKEIASLIFTLVWGTAQVAAVIALLVLASLPAVKPHVDEWDTSVCDRPLGAWSIVWCVRIVVGFFPAIVQFRYKRLTRAHAAMGGAHANQGGGPPSNDQANQLDDVQLNWPQDQQAPPNPPPNASNPPTPPRSSVVALAGRLSSFLTFLSIVWFIVAHVLLYTTLDTCFKDAPHLWYACFAIVCIGYLVILEFLVVGLIIFLIIPLVFVAINTVLVCLGREPIRMGGNINHEVPRLSQRVVDKIPLVLYIPPPPQDFPDKAPPLHLYPPIRTATGMSTASGKGMFRFLKRKRVPASGKDKGKTKSYDKGGTSGVAWEDKWEKGDWPFVRLEENRATCAICLMDFEPPKKLTPSVIDAPTTATPATVTEPAADGSSPHLITMPDALAAGDPDGLLRLEDAGEGVQPLRLLTCGHVFHKTCLDPWLTNSSGRCPTCQKPVEIPDKPQGGRRRGSPNNV